MEYEKLSNLVYDTAFSCGIKNKTGVLSLKVGFACLLVKVFSINWLELGRMGVGVWENCGWN